MLAQPQDYGEEQNQGYVLKTLKFQVVLRTDYITHTTWEPDSIDSHSLPSPHPIQANRSSDLLWGVGEMIPLPLRR